MIMSLHAQPLPPNAIFVNGDIFVGVRQGGAPLPRVQAMAVRGGRIVSLGSTAAVQKLKGKNTRVLDLGGRFVMPGFNDAHVHLASGGFEKLNVNLVGTTSLEEMQQRIAARIKSAIPGEWIIGRGWDHTKWKVEKLPTRQDLDVVTGEHPAIFTRVDGHIAVANTAALRAAGLTAQTRAPQGGAVDLDADGRPTGILREQAQALVRSKIPKASTAQRRRAIELALQEAARWGVTSIQDNSDWQDFLVYEDLERENKLTVRICEWLPFHESLDVLAKHRARHPRNDPLLHTGMLKAYMDGSLGSRTAALLAPYADDSANSGLPQIAQAELNRKARERAAAAFQMGFHAIGDRGLEMALQAFAEAERYAREHESPPPEGATGRRDLRYRVEHVQVVAPHQAERFRELDVIASIQPNHLLTDMHWVVERIGPGRAQLSYPWAELAKNGVLLAFGTDFPVEPITPFRGLYAAVTRKNEAGTQEFFPEQKLRINDAIAAYTTGAAYAEFAEKDKGTLEPGRLADFVVLDRDLTKAPPEQILATKVLRTVVGGKTVYQAE